MPALAYLLTRAADVAHDHRQSGEKRFHRSQRPAFKKGVKDERVRRRQNAGYIGAVLMQMNSVSAGKSVPQPSNLLEVGRVVYMAGDEEMCIRVGAGNI